MEKFTSRETGDVLPYENRRPLELQDGNLGTLPVIVTITAMIIFTFLFLWIGLPFYFFHLF